jgi:hypothetical protein
MNTETKRMVYSKRNGFDEPPRKNTTIDNVGDERLLITVKKVVKPVEIILQND